MAKVIIIGAGAAGLMAGVRAAGHGHNVLILEKNEKAGKKLYITGKGRCNLTNACDTQDFFKNIVSNSKFMYSSIYGFDSAAVIDFFENAGMPVKIERGDRAFPVSDKSSDVIRTLEKRLKAFGGEIRTGVTVQHVNVSDGRFCSVTTEKGEVIEGDCCFVATGGLSYPSTGSTGDGYRFAKEHGHKVTRLLPSLVSIKTAENWVREVQGLSLKNVVLSAQTGGKTVYSSLGEMLFTGDGVSGPLVLTLSALLADTIGSGNRVTLHIDLKPALDNKQLDERILRDFEEFTNKQFCNSLGKLLPSSLIPVIVSLSGIDPQKKVNAVTREEREHLVSLIKSLDLTVKALGGYNEAVVTKGGVDVKQVYPATMESKLVKGLHFIGEVLDVDAFTGGFNLQIAWSTAVAAADSLDSL